MEIILDYRTCGHPECNNIFGVMKQRPQTYCSQLCRYHDDAKFRNEINRKKTRFHKFKREMNDEKRK